MLSSKNRKRIGRAVLLGIVAACLITPMARAQFVQQGSKLVGAGAVGAASQGYAIALSKDGNTAIVGGCLDDARVGAAWVFTRTVSVWSPQGPKLVGSGSVGAANQGCAVALSADGNTAIVGGNLDNNALGAAWIFIRNAGVWTQQGSKIVGSGAVGAARQGIAVSLSDDGNTAIVGGYLDNSTLGAAWVFTRDSGVWTQQGSKLVGSGAVEPTGQGSGVALSADGNTAIIGGRFDSTNVGAVWAFTRSAGVWTQQGPKLVGAGYAGSSSQGRSVALSADGNTAIVGGFGDALSIGAAWIFARNGGLWTQQGAKLVGSGVGGNNASFQGFSVALSSDGSTAAVGGYLDEFNNGATWIFGRSASTWTQRGVKVLGTGGGASTLGTAVALSGDGNTLAAGGAADNANVGAAWVFTQTSLSVTASHQGNFEQGQNGATYTITVSAGPNTGSTSGLVTVTESVPAGLTLVSMSGSGWTCPSNGTTCARGDALAAGSSYPPITAVVNVAVNALSPLTNTVTVSGGGTAGASTTDTATILPQPRLVLSLSHVGNFAQGQPGAAYSLIVSAAANTAPTLGAVTVTESLPAGLTLVSMSGSGWTCPSAGVVCTRGDSLAAGSSYPPIAVVVNVATNAVSPLANTVNISGGGAPGASTSDSTTILAQPRLLVTGNHTGNFVQGQSGATYTLTVSAVENTGPTSGTVTVTETLPAGLTLVSMSGNGWTCPAATCSRANPLVAGSSYPPIAVLVNVAANAPSSLINTFSVAGGAAVAASGADTATILAQPRLLLTANHAGSFAQGQIGATYTLTVSAAANTGPASGTVTVVENLPTGLTLVSMFGAGWTCPAGGTACDRSDALASGSSYPPISVFVNVAANAPSSVTNTVSVTGGGAVGASTTDTTTILPLPKLQLGVTHLGNFTQGQTGATYTLTVSAAANTADVSGTITVTESLPAGLTLVSMAGTGWTCPPGGTTCTRADALASGSSYPPIAAVVNVAANAPSPLTNIVTVSDGGATPAIANDPTTILTLPRLQLDVSHLGNFAQGQTGAYTLTVSAAANAAPTSGTITVTESVPTGLGLVSMSGTGWTCPAGGATCTRADVLASGFSYPSITVVVNVAANAVSPLTNAASVSGGGGSGASVTDTTTILALPRLLLNASHVGNFVQGQSAASYTLTVSADANTAPTSGTIAVTESLPTGLTLVSMSGTGWTCPSGGATCARADALASGSSYPPIGVIVNVAANALPSLSNIASVSGGGAVGASATDATAIIALPRLLLNASHVGDFAQGQNGAAYTLTVSAAANTAPTSGTTIVTENLPTGLALVSMSGTGWTCPAGGMACSRADALAPGFSYPPITALVNVAANALSPLTNIVTASGGGAVGASAADLTTIVGQPRLILTANHLGNFTQGQIGATYTLAVSTAANTLPTSGIVTVTEGLPTGLALISMSGTGWTCPPGGTTCARADVLAPGSSYPPITAVVNVAANALSPLTNVATVSGGGAAGTTTSDATTITTTILAPPTLLLTATHIGNFTQGQTGATYTLTLRTAASTQSTSGTVTVTESLPSGLTLVSMSGSGWNCPSGGTTCARADSLSSSSSYPPISVVVNVTTTEPFPLTNTVTVSGGGAAGVSVSDTTTILAPFMDASPSGFSAAITLLRGYGITGGCQTSPPMYCPDESVTRAQMAIFIVRSILGGDAFASSASPYFADVPSTAFGFQWIQKMYELGVTSGCGGGKFCPNDPVSRAQMAAFVIRARLGVAGDSTFTFPATPFFTDVPATNPFFKWIQRMKRDSITGGCGTGSAYCPDSPVTRGQMAVFLMRGAFNLLLPAGTPIVSDLSPSRAKQGQSVTARVIGVDTNFAQGTTQVAAGLGITVGNITVVNATTLSVELTSAPGAALGPRTIVVSTGNEEAVLPNGFTVTTPP